MIDKDYGWDLEALRTAPVNHRIKEEATKLGGLVMQLLPSPQTAKEAQEQMDLAVKTSWAVERLVKGIVADATPNSRSTKDGE